MGGKRRFKVDGYCQYRVSIDKLRVAMLRRVTHFTGIRMEPNYVKIITNRFIFLLTVLLIPVVSPSAYAKLALSSSLMTVSVEENTGHIANVAIKTGGGESAEFIPILRDGNLLSLGNARAYKISSHDILTDSENEDSIVTVFDFKEGVSLRREIILGDVPYSLRIHYQLHNLSGDLLDIQKSGILQLQFGIGFEGIEDIEGGFGSSVYAYRDPFFSGFKNPTMFERLRLAQLPITESVEWFGWINRYHVIAVRALSERASSRIQLGPIELSNHVGGEIITPKQITIYADTTAILQSGESFRFGFDVVVAPKNRQVLSNAQPRLDGIVLMNLWNWFRWVCIAVGQLLDFLFSVTSNWGITLILAALIIRLITIPTTRVSLQYQKRAAAQQQRMQPLLSAVKAKYSGLELSQQIVNLYEKEHFDQLLPFKSMLGLFIQIPIFIAIFNVLAEKPELSGASFLWISDLAVSDRLFYLGVNLPFFGGYFNLLPFIMAFVTVLSTYYARKDPAKSDMQFSALFGMAGIFFVLFYTFPAAMVLYWTASNFFQLMQQATENRNLSVAVK